MTAAIVGARSREQVDGWIGATDVRLDDERLSQIAAAIEETKAGSGSTRPLTSGGGPPNTAVLIAPNGVVDRRHHEEKG